MATSSGQLRPGRYLALFALIVIALYLLVFLTGDREPTPKLGIDLKGGTRVTLSARTPSGEAPSQEGLQQAQDIIRDRVNSTGVSGAQVNLKGSNIVITVPGENGEKAKQLGETAKLSFRKVARAVPVGAGQSGQSGSGDASDGQSGGKSGGDSGGDSGDDSAGADRSANPSGGGGAATAAQQDSGDGDQSTDGSGDKGDTGTEADTGGDDSEAIKAALEKRQNPKLIAGDDADKKAKQKARKLQQEALSSLDCSKQDPLRGNARNDRPLVACNQDGTEKYVLEPVFLPGQQIDDASAVPPQQGNPGWMVSLEFESQGGDTWAEFTSNNVGERAAFVLDGQVVSAPSINEAMLQNSAQITGDFNRAEAQDLAEVLKYGALPLSFSQSDAKTVSPTLGLASLQAGLIAGAVGIGLVFVYCLFYYRILGVLTILSLILSATLVYGVLVVLGRWIGYSLDLAGVAGLIIAIGVTADSFVIYFERLKDEIREGRTFRSAVSRGWTRARRTILASDAILALASAVLYVLAVGDVKGFAFTLGMSTVLDLLVVFLVTHPLVVLVAKSKKLSSPSLSGLGAVQRMGVDKRSARKPAGAAAKET